VEGDVKGVGTGRGKQITRERAAQAALKVFASLTATTSQPLPKDVT